MSIQQIFNSHKSFDATHASVCASPLDASHRTPRQTRNAPDQQGFAWRGVSGRLYDFEEVCLKDFTLDDTHIYLLLADERAIWVGTSDDLIQDSTSRARFRQALVLAAAAFRLPVSDMNGTQTALHADLLSGHPAHTKHAA